MKNTVADIGEKKLLRRISPLLGRGQPIVRTFSEDCAVVDSGGGNYQLYTVDALVEGVHFDSAFTTPYLIGRKALKVNVSDISAMGGWPLYSMVSIGLPKRTPIQVVDDIYRGMGSVARKLGIKLLGGNISSAKNLFIDIFLVGEVPKRNAIFRNGAREGDFLFVSGALGASAQGLQLLRSGFTLSSRKQGVRQAIRAHLDPPCLNAMAREIASWGCLTSMIDISDGLAADLAEICRESGVGAVVRMQQVPVAKSVEGEDSRKRALTGGEDYQLLFTVSRKKYRAFLRKLAASRHRFFEIGRIVPRSAGLKLVDEKGKERPLSGGFEHF